MLKETDLMPFGKHRGIPMEEVPDEWLKWFYNTVHGKKINGPPQQKVYEYIVDNLDAINENLS